MEGDLFFFYLDGFYGSEEQELRGRANHFRRALHISSYRHGESNKLIAFDKCCELLTDHLTKNKRKNKKSTPTSRSSRGDDLAKLCSYWIRSKSNEHSKSGNVPNHTHFHKRI